MSATPLSLRMPILERRSLRRPALIAALATIAVLILGYVATNVYASMAQRDLDRRLDEAIARWAPLDPVAKSQIAYAAGDPVARLVAEEISLDVVVAEGATPSVMRRAPGHLSGSVTPGDTGVAIVTANRFGFGSYFARLDGLAVGDRILTESVFGRTTYTVTEVRTVPAGSMDLGTESTQRVLVLFGSARMWGGSDRIVVRAVAGEAPRP